MWEFQTCWKTPFVETSVLNTNSIQLFSPLRTQQFLFLPANHHVSKSSNDSWILPFFSLENHEVFPTKGVAFKFNPKQKNTQPTSPRSASQSSLPNNPLSAPRRRIMDSKSTTLPKFHLPPASLGVWLLTVTVAVFKAPKNLCAAQPSICCIYMGAI